MQFENNVRYAVTNAYQEQLFEGEAYVSIVTYMKILKSWSQKKQKMPQLGLLRPIHKPDCDNIIKSVLDGMNTVTKKDVIVKNGIYKDKNQVVEVRIRQFYSIRPRTKVVVLLNDRKKLI